MQAKIKSKEMVAKDTLQVKLSVDPSITFTPGQYLFISLINPPLPDDRNNRRHFSIVNSPNEKQTLTFTTRLRDSGFKKNLQQLPEGTEVKLGPLGESFALPESKSRPLVFIAGGIGTTPFISMLRYISEEKLPFKITLIYSNRNKQSTAYFDELISLEQTLPDFKLIFTMTGDPDWKGEKRRVDKQLIKEHTASLKNPVYFVVGPPQMAEAVMGILRQMGVDEEDIKAERFTGY